LRVDCKQEIFNTMSDGTQVMSEKQLWQYLTDLWSTPAQFELKAKSAACVQPCPGDPAAPGHEFCFGICQCLVRLSNSHDIHPNVFKAAQKRLAAYLKAANWNGGYFYPITEAGAKQRAFLCGQFAQAVA